MCHLNPLEEGVGGGMGVQYWKLYHGTKGRHRVIIGDGAVRGPVLVFMRRHGLEVSYKYGWVEMPLLGPC